MKIEVRVSRGTSNLKYLFLHQLKTSSLNVEVNSTTGKKSVVGPNMGQLKVFPAAGKL